MQKCNQRFLVTFKEALPFTIKGFNQMCHIPYELSVRFLFPVSGAIFASRTHISHAHRGALTFAFQARTSEFLLYQISATQFRQLFPPGDAKIKSALAAL